MDTMFYKWSYVLVRALEMIKACYYPDLCVSAGGGGALVQNEARWSGVLSHLAAHKQRRSKQKIVSKEMDGLRRDHQLMMKPFVCSCLCASEQFTVKSYRRSGINS